MPQTKLLESYWMDLGLGENNSIGRQNLCRVIEFQAGGDQSKMANDELFRME